MSTAELRKRIGIIELALKNAGPEQALNAILGALNEIASLLESIDKPVSGGLPPQTPPKYTPPVGRMFKEEE
jgi:hypothetical protein